MTRRANRGSAYQPASGSEAVVCWILIVACLVIILLTAGAWFHNSAVGSPIVQVFLSTIVVLGAVARLRGWAPLPKGGAGGVGP